MLKRPLSHTPTPTRSTFEEASQTLLPIASTVLTSLFCNSLVTSPLLSPSPCVFGEHKVDQKDLFHQHPIKRQKISEENSFKMDNFAEAGPSKQPFLLRADAPGLQKSLSTNTSSNKPRKRPAKLALNPNTPSKRSGEASPGSRSVPASPMVGENKNEEANRQGPTNDLRDTLCGAPRRRPSVLFNNRTPALPLLDIPARSHSISKESSVPNSGPPAIWQDPSEHILSGKGSSLQHARSVYASGPIEVLPGLFLGDEFNARDEQALARLGISTILNVAKETTLPCQSDESSHDLGFLRQSVNLSRGLEKRLTLNDEAATPTSSRPPVMNLTQRIGAEAKMTDSPPMSAIREKFFTPVTSFPPVLMSPAPPQISQQPPSTTSSRPSSLYLRNTASTPNLNICFQNTRNAKVLPGAYRSGTDSSSDEEEEETGDEETEEGGESAATSSLNSHLSTAPSEGMDSLSPHDERKQFSPSDFSVTTPSSSTFSRKSPAMANTSISSSSSTSASSSAGSYTIALPNDAVALSVPPSPKSNRTWPIRYIKLPWTHDETDLAGLSSTGGFVTGCAIIADALGIDLRTGRLTPRVINSKGSSVHDRRSGVLVHCQCGVSRSATLVIAFVMQAAAYEYDFEKTRDLTGMHDCYEMVKGLSSSISPNISLIYQLVEWERLLSSQVAMQIDQHTAVRPEVERAELERETGSAQHDHTAGRNLTGVAQMTERKWGKEVMGEEDWMRMRAEEERKEQEEEAEKEKRLEEAKAREAEWRAAQGLKAPSGKLRPKALQLAVTPQISAASNNGVGGRRKKPSPSLTLVSSSKTNADRALGLSGAKTAVTLLAPTSEEKEDSREDVQMAGPDDHVNEPQNVQQSRNSTIFPWLKGQQQAAAAGERNAQSESSSRVNSRPGSGYGASSFGVMGQSAAERRIKHKRTFSAEVPDWNSRQSVLSRSKTHDAANRLSTLSVLAASAEDTPPSTAAL